MAEADEVWPPKVPCPGLCEYGACGEPGGPSRNAYGCGGCCRCLGGCRLEYDVEQVMIPETPEQHRLREHWEAVAAITTPRGGPFPL